MNNKNEYTTELPIIPLLDVDGTLLMDYQDFKTPGTFYNDELLLALKIFGLTWSHFLTAFKLSIQYKRYEEKISLNGHFRCDLIDHMKEKFGIVVDKVITNNDLAYNRKEPGAYYDEVILPVEREFNLPSEGRKDNFMENYTQKWEQDRIYSHAASEVFSGSEYKDIKGPLFEIFHSSLKFKSLDERPVFLFIDDWESCHVSVSKACEKLQCDLIAIRATPDKKCEDYLKELSGKFHTLFLQRFAKLIPQLEQLLSLPVLNSTSHVSETKTALKNIKGFLNNKNEAIDYTDSQKLLDKWAQLFKLSLTLHQQGSRYLANLTDNSSKEALNSTIKTHNNFIKICSYLTRTADGLTTLFSMITENKKLSSEINHTESKQNTYDKFLHRGILKSTPINTPAESNNNNNDDSNANSSSQQISSATPTNEEVTNDVLSTHSIS